MQTVRDMADTLGMEYVGGLFTSSLVKGQEFTLNSTAYKVTLVSDKSIRFQSADGKNIEARKFGSHLVSTGTRKSQPYDQFSRDLEGVIACDLINENNPFHKRSQVFQMVQAALDAMNESDDDARTQHPRQRNH
jgi:hypothetical protein